MKNSKSIPRKVGQKKSKFVSTFLRQPCKTRSGRRYSRHRAGSSEESLLGSLAAKNRNRKQVSRKRGRKKKRKYRKCYSSSSSSGGGCECENCVRSDAEDSDTVRSRHRGIDLLFKKGKQPKKKRSNTAGKKKEAKKNRSNVTCSTCLSANSLTKITSKTQKGKRQQKRMKRKTKGANKNLSLLRYVLSKTGSKLFSSDSTLHKRIRKLEPDTRCACCGEFFMTLSELEHLVPEDLFDNGDKRYRKHISMKRLKSILRAMSARRKSVAPSGSAGCITKSIGQQTSNAPKKMLPETRSHAQKTRRIIRTTGRPTRGKSVSSILFPSTGAKSVKKVNQAEPTGQDLNTLIKRIVGGRNMAPIPSAKASDIELQIALEAELQASPPPSCSHRLPTFIVMIKTAIRDLRPFKITSMEAISKYIELRYRVKNDNLLNYILEWMVDMRVLRAWSGHYYFTKSRLVKKTTVAVLGKGAGKHGKNKKLKKVTSKQKKKNAKKLWKKGFKQCNVHKNGVQFAQKGRGKKGKQIDESELDDEQNNAPKSRKNKHKKGKKSGRKQKKNKDKKTKCTCTKELTSAKNRVKLKTRYVRRRGKIYREEEFV
ncbi:uncharacterized protein LOC120348611 [Styela clava]